MLPPAFDLPEPPWIVAHRGASADEPENTLASVAVAVAQGAHMVEIDVQLTSDDQLVLMHDWEIVTDGRRTTVEESTAEEVGAALATSRGETLPSLATLAAVLESLPETVPLNIEIKHRRAGVVRVGEHVLRVVADRPRVLISSFDWKQLATIRRARPELPLAPIGSQRPHDLLRAAESLGAATIHCHRRLAFTDFLSASRAGGWPVLVYTINEPALADSLFERGVAGIFTDRPGEMLRSLCQA